MTTVKISETYDLSTQVDKLALIGIHTPSLAQIQNHWSGLVMNHKFVRLVSCDVMIACASMLPADPLQIGTEAGQIAPQDMFNPILYKAVSNDAFGTIQNKIYANSDFAGDSYGNNLMSANEGFVDEDAFAVYYGLLSEDGRFRKAMPQNGLEMTGLYPIVHQVVAPYASMNTRMDVLRTAPDSLPVDNDSQATDIPYGNLPFRGGSLRMPSIPLHNGTYQDNEIPQTYVAAIVMPPAKLHRLYYRMKVIWTVEFSGLCSVNEYRSLLDIASTGRRTYVTDYAEQSAMMSAKTNMVDVKDADITKIMDGTK